MWRWVFLLLTTAQVQSLAQAIYWAEGGTHTRHPYGIVSVPVSSVAEARQICERTIRHTYQRWTQTSMTRPFLDFLASRYAPLDARNDPQHLNQHWVSNVRWFLAHPQELP